METNTAFVRANGIVELHTIAEVRLNFTLIIHPRYAESKDTVRFNQTFYNFRFLELGMLIIDIFDGKKNFLYGLKILRLAGCFASKEVMIRSIFIILRFKGYYLVDFTLFKQNVNE